MSDHQELLQRLERLNAIGVALSAERNLDRLMEDILRGAMEITNADGGTLYMVTDDQHLRFQIMRTKSLNFAMGGTTGKQIPYPPLPLYLEGDAPNTTLVAACAVLEDRVVNIEDAYEAKGFDFSGTRKFDQNTGYRSKSFLTIPMKNHENEIIGVLQLLNAMDSRSGEIVAFSQENERLVKSLASQAAVALTNHNLIEGLKKLFESFISLIAKAIDEKSPYTGGHCMRVPRLTMMIAEAANACEEGPLAGFRMNDKEMYELSIAALLHDCGKVATPEYVVDKPRKLTTIFDRIEQIATRYEVLKRDAEIEFLKARLAAAEKDSPGQVAELEKVFRDQLLQYEEELVFLRHINFGGESMRPEDQARVDTIASRTWNDAGKTVPFLSEDEVYNLKIARGTLTKEERDIINNHIVVTISMLNSLPYPNDLKRVPEYAGGHHERMDGKGYPNGLTREEMSIPARMMGVADIFEALTARDRPYKPAKTLSESLEILGRMKLDNHIDPDIFDLFVRKKIYLNYARQLLPQEQIDEVDEAAIPGYVP